MNREPGFQNIGVDRKKLFASYPNGFSERDVESLFTNHRDRMGSLFFKRDSTVFMLDVDEKRKEVIVRHLISNEYDVSKFCNTYFDVKERVEKLGGIFRDGRYDVF